MHSFEQVSDDVIRSTLDRLAITGLPIYISELDLSFSDDQEQLARFKTLFPMLWLHPAVKGITLWGYREYHIWRKYAYLVRTGGTERPALTWLKQYLRDYNARAFSSARYLSPTRALWTVGAIIVVLMSGGWAWLYLRREKTQK